MQVWYCLRRLWGQTGATGSRWSLYSEAHTDEAYAYNLQMSKAGMISRWRNWYEWGYYLPYVHDGTRYMIYVYVRSKKDAVIISVVRPPSKYVGRHETYVKHMCGPSRMCDACAYSYYLSGKMGYNAGRFWERDARVWAEGAWYLSFLIIIDLRRLELLSQLLLSGTPGSY